MTFIEIAKSRYSCRKYKDNKVEDEKLKLILEAARIAPTGANRQPQQLIVVQEKAGLDSISKGANIFNAPLAIIVCCDTSKSWVRPFDNKQLTDTDASIVTDHMMLQATELGLNSVWVCYFKPDVIKEEFNIPSHIEPINILVIGYGDEQPQSPNRHSQTRLPLDKTVSFERFK